MNSDYKYIYEYINHIDVECPNCSNKSVVKSNPDNREETKFTCTHCGKSSIWKGDSNSYGFGIQSQKSNGILIGQPVDCYFKLKLWYTANFKGETLFAYNKEHLIFLYNYIDNKLRARTKTKTKGEWSNGSLQSRLPKWMLKADNREEIIKKIKELKNK